MSNKFPYILGIVIFFLLLARSLTAQTSNYSFSGDYLSHSQNNNNVQVVFDGGFLNVRYFKDIGFHVHYAKDQLTESTSENSRKPETQVPEIQENQDRIRISASNDVLIIQKKPLRLRFEHKNGLTYVKESFGAGWYQDRPIHVFEKDAKRFLYATHHEHRLGKAVLGFGPNDSWAIFYENSSVNRIELGSQSVSHWGFSADGGVLQFIFVSGEKPADLFKKYRLYKGVSQMPPQWALGFHTILQGDASSQDILDYSLYLRKGNLPIDVIHLNNKILSDGVPFTWDGTKVPDSYNFADQLLAKGVRLVLPLTSTFPNQSTHHFISEGIRQGIFFNTNTSDSSMAYSYSPTLLKLNSDHPSAIHWWKTQLEKEIRDKIAGFSISEPLFIPNDGSILDRIYTSSTTASNKNNSLASLTSQALSEIQLKQRPLVYNELIDAHSIANSHYTSSGNVINQISLDVSVNNIIDFGILGYPGSMLRLSKSLSRDISIYQRALSLAAFVPGIAIEDNVSERGTSLSDSNNDLQLILRQYAALRYHFTPMIYTAWWQHTQESSPIIRPSWWYGLEQLNQITDHFYIGDHLWYTPRFTLSQINPQKDLPKGIWYHYFTKKQVSSNILSQIAGQTTTLHQNAYKSMALFARAGAVIPTR